MAINIITGRPGMGKTYLLTYLAKAFLEEGTEVYSNYKLEWKGKNLHYWENLKELQHVEKGVILMDEAHVYFNSREWSHMPKYAQKKLQQHRKDGLHIWGTAQSENRIDVVYRELVSSFFECKKIWRVIWVREYFPEDMQKDKKEPISNQFFFVKKSIYDFYDTLQKVGNSGDNELTHEVRICPECKFEKITHS